MIPYFNTSGPCVPGQQYMLPPERRLTRVLELVEQERYFTLHAGRQTGKTTSVQWLVEHLNRGDQYAAMWVDLQPAQEQPDIDRAMREILLQLDRSLSRDLPDVERPEQAQQDAWLRSPSSSVREYLRCASDSAARPLVVVFDSVDGLVGKARLSFLTSLRAGYIERAAKVPFPHSVALVGRVRVGGDECNIIAEPQTLAPFSREEVAELLAQHTAATGQRFEADAALRVHELSQGQPGLVNALADLMVRDVRDRTEALTAAHVEAAKETIILERRTHIDSLVARLHEERVRRVPVLGSLREPPG